MPTILIIDDDPTTLGLLRTRLEKARYTVKEARDGQDGLRTAERERPDLIFLDVRMPKVDGWQVCKTLKSNPFTSHCPIIMLTGCSQDTQELYGLQCGADEYLTKPWDAVVLLKTVTKLLQQASAGHDIRSETSQQRMKQFAQRVVRIAGKLPKKPECEPMAAQLMGLATSLITTYQAVLAPGAVDLGAKIGLMYKQAEELLYWLGLLQDSKASDDADIPLLKAEGQVLVATIGDAVKNRPSKSK